MNSSIEIESISSAGRHEVPESNQQKERLADRVLRYVLNLAQFVRLLLGLMMDSRVDTKVKVFVGAVLAYIFAPVDFIPELFSGLFGLVDDFVLSAFAINVILNWLDPAIVRSHWHGETDLLETIQKGMKNAELLVPEPIVKKIQTWIGRHIEKAVAVSAKSKLRKKKADSVE